MRLTTVAPAVTAGEVERLVHVSHEMDEEAEGDVTGMSLSIHHSFHRQGGGGKHETDPHIRGDVPLSSHQSRRLVHDRRQDIDVLVHPSVFSVLAVVGRVVQFRYDQLPFPLIVTLILPAVYSFTASPHSCPNPPDGPPSPSPSHAGFYRHVRFT